MANVTDLRIDLAAQFTGKTAFDKAQSSTAKLERSVKNLGKAIGFSLGTAAIVRFGKSAASAFIQDEKAASVLANTMKNLGLQMSAPSVEAYIQSLERATGVVDDQLRPAMQTLLQVTGSVINSQKILTQAIEVSRATGIDLTTVAQDLGQAYVGNTRGLRKYSLGLTQAELKSASFADIQARLTKLFGGANEAYLATYAGQMERLGVAAGEAKETIGKGLVDALIALSGSKGVDELAAKIEGIAKTTAGLINGIAKFIVTTQGLFSGRPTSEIKAQFAAPSYKGAIPSISAMVQKSEQAKAEKAAISRQKELLSISKKQNTATAVSVALKKESAILEKASALLNQAQNLFDSERIQIAAAAQGKLSEEDKVRVKLKQDILDLEDAIQNKNVAAVLSFSNAIVEDSQKLSSLRSDMAGLSDVNNPFNAWLDSLKAISNELAAIANQKTSQLTLLSAGEYFGNVPKYFSSPQSLGLSDQANTARNAAMANSQINYITVQGSVTSERDLVAAITDAMYNNQASGVPSNYTTRY